MGRPKGSKNKPKDSKAAPAKKVPAKKVEKTKKPAVTTLGTQEAPVTKKVVEETAKTAARKTKDGGVVIAAPKDASGEPDRYDVVMRGGQAVKVKSTDDPDLD